MVSFYKLRKSTFQEKKKDLWCTDEAFRIILRQRHNTRLRRYLLLLQNQLNSDVARFTTHIKPVLQQIRLLTGLTVGCKTRHIAIQLVLQQCCRTSYTFVARFYAPYPSLPSPPPSFIFWFSFHFSRDQNRKSPSTVSFAPKPNGNACYASYTHLGNAR